MKVQTSRFFTWAIPLILSFQLASSAAAQCSAVSCDNYYITRIMVTNDGNVNLKIGATPNSGFETPTNCTHYNGGFMRLDKNEPGFHAILSVLLSVQARGVPLTRVRMKNLPTMCDILYVWQDN